MQEHKMIYISHCVSNLWKAILLHPTNVTGDFTHREFPAALKNLKSRKGPGPDSICPELVMYAEADFKFWLYVASFLLD